MSESINSTIETIETLLGEDENKNIVQEFGEAIKDIQGEQEITTSTSVPTKVNLSKKRKILDVSANNQYFNLDIRISIPRSQISDEMVTDLLNAKEELVNGSGNQVFHAKIALSEDGKDLIEIGTDSYFGN